MHTLCLLSCAFLVLFSILDVAEGKPNTARAVGMQKYTRPHSLGENYMFDARDGWQMINITNLQYKYRRNHTDTRQPNDAHGQEGRPSPKSGSGWDIQGTISRLMKGTGNPTRVVITWWYCRYTGHDLENPSCWSNGKWAPTDESFACALTLHGWSDRPQCFQFIELCNGPKKCIFVRVVDSCAGCAQGSKHVDLTKGAFKHLADPEVGRLDGVRMRVATEPLGNW
ncbi:hypothetical protein P691DRAFT_660930 [Macrolepiota fuliginosa MF-IS2]|uniref:RlpA-like protein double-psi beta-barrel domain-containing protein n=1 Tax=Macrolepiota fuliginosa MF-IS2 TaxID=1400762 RepID=A0A9P6C810_9AGAR|nr:hypothetical protein P691DRAFT_660930 [Macrolepiota fuliginosa MF-IS2]